MAEAGRGNGKREGLSPGEKRRLRQLMVCLLLFGLVFLGRGTDLGPVSRLSSQAGELVRSDTDFQAVFAQVGASFSQGQPAVETFRSLWDGLVSRDSRQEETAQEAGDGEAVREGS